MDTRTPKTTDSQAKGMAGVLQQKKTDGDGMSYGPEESSGGLSQRRIVDSSPQALQLKAYHNISNGISHSEPPVQKKANDTGLPDNLKSGIENLSGYSLDDVKVHYNSPQPAQLQAHAYAQGSNIHVAPGQEKHLPHEAWHVVQQKQGRVKPTLQMKGKVNVNDDAGLEKEADVMGAKALQLRTATDKADWKTTITESTTVQLGKERRGPSKPKKEAAPKPVEPKVNKRLEKEKAKASALGSAPVPASSASASASGEEASASVPAASASASAEKGDVGDLGQNYLEDLRTTNMWGGYAEANAIATHLEFRTSIFQSVGGTLRLLAILGTAGHTVKGFNLMWNGDHYQVIEGGADAAPTPAVDHDPAGDGNCLFEAMYYIMRNAGVGGGHAGEGAVAAKRRMKAALSDDVRRGSAVRNMRDIAATRLAQDPATLNYLGAEHQQAINDKKGAKWNTNLGKATITDIQTYKTLLAILYKAYPPQNYFIKPDKGTSILEPEDDFKAKPKADASAPDPVDVNVGVFLRDNAEVRALLPGSDSSSIRSKFETWLHGEAAYRKKGTKRGTGEDLPPGHDRFSFKISDAAGIFDFLVARVATSKNLQNISQHLGPQPSASSMKYETKPVYHYSRGKPDWGAQYTAFFILLNDTYVKIIGIGSHVEGGSASYKLAWGIGSGAWVSGANIKL